MGITFYLPVVLAVVSYTFYNFVQDRIGDDKNAYILLAYAHFIGIIVVIICYFAVPMGGKPGLAHLMEHLSMSNWATILMGIGTFCLMVGFLFCYRVGWSIAVAPLIISAVGSAMLTLEGVIIYHEGMSILKALGFLMIIGGLFLVNIESKNKNENEEMLN